MSETTWRKEIEGAMLGSGDKCTTLICTLSKEELELPLTMALVKQRGHHSQHGLMTTCISQ